MKDIPILKGLLPASFLAVAMTMQLGEKGRFFCGFTAKKPTFSLKSASHCEGGTTEAI